MSADDWQRIEACLQRRILSPGETLLEEGKICRNLWFLESGFLRYHTNKDGQDVTKFFTKPPYCFTSSRSFSNQIPGDERIEVIEESVVWELTRADVYRLFELNSWSTFTRELIAEVQYFTQQILEELQSETAETRYLKMLTEGDEILQRVPLKYLASYLGIAPQSLSRIRRKIAEDFLST